LQYCSPSWSAYTVAGKVLESVQRRAVNIISNIRRSHEEKLRNHSKGKSEKGRYRKALILTTKFSSGLHPPDIELVTPVVARTRCSKDLEFTSKLNDIRFYQEELNLIIIEVEP